jgi:hypothetical protein
MFLGQLPKRLVIGCVDSDALNGTITKNPFDFKHYKINFVALNVDGRQIPTLCTVVKQDLSVSIDFDHVVKFCIQDDVDGPCQSFGEMNLHGSFNLCHHFKKYI